MPDVKWIMENCHMMRDNGVWAGEKQISYCLACLLYGWQHVETRMSLEQQIWR